MKQQKDSLVIALSITWDHCANVRLFWDGYDCQLIITHTYWVIWLLKIWSLNNKINKHTSPEEARKINILGDLTYIKHENDGE